MEQDDKLRKEVQLDIDNFAIRLQEDVRNRKREQQRLGFAMARVSPVAAYQLAVMDVAGTDMGIKTRFEDALTTYRTTFNEYRDRKMKAAGSFGGMRIMFDSERGVKIDQGREETLDLTDMPQFVQASVPMAEAVQASIVDLGLLAGAALLAFAAAVIAFLRYDVR